MTFGLDGEHCQSCGRKYREVWAADDESWSRVVNRYGGGLRCPDCFKGEAESAGVKYTITINGYLHTIDAVILGGETGPGARPLHPDWVRKVRDDCKNAGVPFFFKGWGEWIHEDHFTKDMPKYAKADRFYELDQNHDFFRVGRKKAGRLLDGRTHDELPWVKEGR